MFGAVRPPWVDKEMFYRMPFNFCDHWCERCKLISICRVYKDIEKRRKKFKKRDKDPNSMEGALEIIGESFKETKTLLEKSAKKWGIDLNSLKEDESITDDLELELKEFPLYRLAYQYSGKLKNLLEELSFIAPEVNTNSFADALEVINYYHLMLPAKIYRACISKKEEDEDKDDTNMDSKTSGFIAVRGLSAIIDALSNLASYPFLKPVYTKIINLNEISENLINLITAELDLKIQN